MLQIQPCQGQGGVGVLPAMSPPVIETLQPTAIAWYEGTQILPSLSPKIGIVQYSNIYGVETQSMLGVHM